MTNSKTEQHGGQMQFCCKFKHKTRISRPFFSISGSVFLERDLLLHQAFGQIFDQLNDNENYLNGTRVDYNIQYADLDQFDAYQKACMEMTYRYVWTFSHIKIVLFE